MQIFPATRSERFIHSYWRLKQAMLHRVNPRLKSRYGFEFLELMLLAHIDRTDMNPSELCEALKIPAPAVSRRLDALERGGLIARGLDKQDARRRVLSLTGKGQSVLAEAGETLRHEIDSMLEALPESQLECFLGALETIAHPAPEER